MKLKAAEMQLEDSYPVLSPDDHFALISADKDAEIAALKLNLAKSQQRETKLAAQIQEQGAHLAVMAAQAASEGAKQACRDLADKVAKAYGVDWTKTALEPLSGQLRPIEG